MFIAFYDKIKTGEAKDTATKLKSDATYFSIADGIVQHMFIEYLFKGNKFGQIVGEEDGTVVNIKTTPYTVDDLEVPSEFNNLISLPHVLYVLFSAAISTSQIGCNIRRVRNQGIMQSAVTLLLMWWSNMGEFQKKYELGGLPWDCPSAAAIAAGSCPSSGA